MIKECKVLKWNECVMVIDFDGNEVQMPSDKRKLNVVYVKFDKKQYSLVTEDEYRKSFYKNDKNDKKEKSDFDEK